MRLPTPLSRNKPNVHKNQFGHVLVLAGSRRMLGAAALTGLAALRSGAGLVTVGIPRSLNEAAHKKISNAVMTLPLNETHGQTLAPSAYDKIRDGFSVYSVIAIGPGMSRDPGTRRLIARVIETSPIPLVIDADALNALQGRCGLLKKSRTVKVLTPHTGEMSRLLGKSKLSIEQDRRGAAQGFAQKYNCILLLKGAKTVVASPKNKIYINTRTGNAGMAKAGSGDILTGMIAAFMAQGLSGFDAAKYGAYLHGKAGDLAAKSRTKLSMIAPDIIDYIPNAIRSSK